MSPETFTKNSILPDGKATVNADSPSESNDPPDNSSRISFDPISPGTPENTVNVSEDGSASTIRARNLPSRTTLNPDSNGPVIARPALLDFQVSNISNASLVSTFIFLQTIEDFGIVKATHWAEIFHWKLTPGLFEVSADICRRRMVQSENDANEKGQTAQGIREEDGVLHEGRISRTTQQGD